MKVLVVHDREDVLQDIVELLKSLGVSGGDISVAEDGSGARSHLNRTLFDLAIFDLTIPSVKGRAASGYSVADDIFTEMFHGDSIYNIPGDLIGITKEPGALQGVNSSIGPHLMAVVQEDAAGGWRDLLSDRITYVQRSTASRLRSLLNRYDYDVAIITALDEELLPLKDSFALSPLRQFPGAEEFTFTDSTGALRRGVAVSVGAAGQAACASFTQAMIARFRPKLFLMMGFCGGYKAKTKPGEVLFFQTVYDWDSGKWVEEKGKARGRLGGETEGDLKEAAVPVFLPRPEPINIRHSEVIRVARKIYEIGLSEHVKTQRALCQLSGNKIEKIELKIVSAASGSAVIGHAEVLGKIRLQNDKIAAVDMESYGFYSACEFTPNIKPAMICIKSVADFCDGEKDDTLHAACCFISAKVVEEIMTVHWNFSSDDFAPQE